MRQSNIIFGTIIFAFIVYITSRGQLPSYLNLFRKGANLQPYSATPHNGLLGNTAPTDNSSINASDILNSILGRTN